MAYRANAFRARLPVTSHVGDRAAEFEADLRGRLLAIVPSGVFRDEPSFAYDLGRR